MENAKDSQEIHKAPFWISARFGLAVLLSFGLYCTISLRINVNMAIVCMVNHTDLSFQTERQADTNWSECGLTSTNQSAWKHKDGPFVWDRMMQGHIVSIFYLPYGITHIPSSILINRFGARQVFGFSTIIAAFVTFLIPLVATYSFLLVVIIRGILGLLMAGVYVCCQYILGRWAPATERTRLSSICYVGIELGTIGTYFISGLMCDHLGVDGWSYIFYLTAGLSLVWCLFWFAFASDTPEQSKWISKQEKEYISQTKQITKDTEKIKTNKHVIPWRSLFTSLPVYSIMVANICSDWAYLLMATYVPTYLNDVFGFDFEYNGFVSSISSLPHAAAMLFSGRLSDFILNRYLSRTKTRKLFNTTGMIVPAVLLLTLGYIDCSKPILAVVILTAGMAIRGFRFSGFVVNSLDITPYFGGVVFSVTNSISSICGYVALMITSSITTNLSRQEWQIVFILTSAIEIFGSLFYLMFASTDVQSWNSTNKDEDKVSELTSDIVTHM